MRPGGVQYDLPLGLLDDIYDWAINYSAFIILFELIKSPTTRNVCGCIGAKKLSPSFPPL